jgi:hypothetical protein
VRRGEELYSECTSERGYLEEGCKSIPEAKCGVIYIPECKGNLC